MLLTAFGFYGRLPLPFGGEVAVGYRYGTPAKFTDPAVGAPGQSTAGQLVQGPMRISGREVRAAAARVRPRTLVTGWIDLSPLGCRDGATALEQLQRRLDQDGPTAVRQLRGDFVIAHLSPDHTALRLYRAVDSMIPLFWRQTADQIIWATDPVQLLDGPEPRLSDVEVDLLPMIVAELGLPHERSWFVGVRRLATGDCLTLERNQPHPVVRRFDAFAPLEVTPERLRDAGQGLQRRLAQACSRMLSTEDRALLLLSGGMDSAAVAYELGQLRPEATGLHFTLESFPGFDEDHGSAAAVARSCGLSLVTYDLSRHVVSGGSYLDEPQDGSLPQTHVPQPGPPVAVGQAEAIGATFVLSGLLSDQILADDQHNGLFQAVGWSLLNPMVAGEPIWQTLGQIARTSFASSVRGGPRLLGHLRSLLGADPTVALPDQEMMVHPVGFTREAAEQVTQALRRSALQAQHDLKSAAEGNGASRHRVPRGIASTLLVKEAFNSPNLQAAWLNHYLPRQRIFTSPYADRDVIEYALALPPEHRLGFGHGLTVDKFALRVAYASKGVPLQIGRRMHQARIDAIPAVFVNQNFETCRRLLGKDSVLRRLGVVSDEFAAGLSPRNVHCNGEKLARLCAIEQWLRRLSR